MVSDQAAEASNAPGEQPVVLVNMNQGSAEIARAAPMTLHSFFHVGRPSSGRLAAPRAWVTKSGLHMVLWEDDGRVYDGGVIRITPSLAIRESELVFTFTTSQGPGGQNVNKVATKALLSFDVAQSPSLAEAQRGRILQALGSRINKDGVLQIACSTSRSQESNRRGAIEVFTALMASALRPRKRRRATKPSRSAVERRLASKAVRSARKRERGQREFD